MPAWNQRPPALHSTDSSAACADEGSSGITARGGIMTDNPTVEELVYEKFFALPTHPSTAKQPVKTKGNAATNTGRK